MSQGISTASSVPSPEPTLTSRILAVIAAAPGPLPGPQIAAVIGTEKRRVSYALRDLRRRGLVVRRGHKKGARWLRAPVKGQEAWRILGESWKGSMSVRGTTKKGNE